MSAGGSSRLVAVYILRVRSIIFVKIIFAQKKRTWMSQALFRKSVVVKNVRDGVRLQFGLQWEDV